MAGMGYSVGVYRIFSSLFKPRNEVSRSTGMHKYCNPVLGCLICCSKLETVRPHANFHHKLLISPAALVQLGALARVSHTLCREIKKGLVILKPSHAWPHPVPQEREGVW